jgi:hypothetical protein
LVPKLRDYISVPSSWTAWPLKIWLTCSTETSASDYLTTRINPEDVRIHVRVN